MEKYWIQFLYLLYRNQIVNRKEGVLSPDCRCSMNGCWYCSSLCKLCMKATDQELCNKCHTSYSPASSKQQPVIEHINLHVSILHDYLHAELHVFHVDELETQERVAISIYKCTKPLYTEVDHFVCLLKTPQWQRIRIVRRLLSSGTCNLMEGDENDPQIAILCEKVIKKVFSPHINYFVAAPLPPRLPSW